MPSCNIKKSLPILLFAECLSMGFLHAQRTEVSPYSAFGLGDLVTPGFAEQRIMGSVSVANTDGFELVPNMPSTYAAMNSAVFATSLGTQFLKLESDNTTSEQTNTRFLGFAVAVPFAQGKWGIGFGLLPNTSVGYEIVTRSQLDDGSGEVRYEYTGQGGLNRAYVGLSRRLWASFDTVAHTARKLYFGADLNYQFGSIGRTRKAFYPLGQGYFNTKSTSDVIIRDPSFDVAVQYQLIKRQGGLADGELWQMAVGAFAEMPASLGARRSDLVTTFFGTASGVEFTRDTISNSEGVEGTIGLPLAIGAGVSLSYDERWTFAVEHRRRDWNDLEVNVDGWEIPERLGASASYSLGIAWLPAGGKAFNISTPFFQKISYRAGSRYLQDYLVVRDQQLEDLGISFGMSVLLQSRNPSVRSRLTIGAELGSRGTTDNGAISERYAHLLFGISITPHLKERWFQKRKIQ